MKLKTLVISTVSLFMISLIIFFNENKRGSDLVSGSEFIKGLDVSKIHKIVLTGTENKKVVLIRDNDRFLVENKKGYFASSDKINDVVYKIASLQVREKVSEKSNEEDLKKYQLDPNSRSYLVEVFDNDDKKTVSFSVGKNYKGKGNYLIKSSSDDIYLSQTPFGIELDTSFYINSNLISLNKNEIEKIEIKDSKNEFLINASGEKITLEGVKKKKVKEEKLKECLDAFSSVKFKDFYNSSDEKVRDLQFNKTSRIHLKNGLIYALSFSKLKDDIYVKVNALTNEIPKQIVVNQDDGQDKLKNIQNMVEAAGIATRVNTEKGSWIYSINENIYQKIAPKIDFFL